MLQHRSANLLSETDVSQAAALGKTPAALSGSVTTNTQILFHGSVI